MTFNLKYYNKSLKKKSSGFHFYSYTLEHPYHKYSHTRGIKKIRNIPKNVQKNE